MYTYVYIIHSIYIYIYVYTWYIYIYIYTCVYIYIYIYVCARILVSCLCVNCYVRLVAFSDAPVAPAAVRGLLRPPRRHAFV